MGFEGPSKTIIVEPQEEPVVPPPLPEPQREAEPEREEVAA